SALLDIGQPQTVRKVARLASAPCRSMDVAADGPAPRNPAAAGRLSLRTDARTRSCTSSRGSRAQSRRWRADALPDGEDQVDTVTPATDGAERETRTPAERRLARRLGLRRIAVDALTIRRVRRGRGFAYLDANGTCIRDRRLTRRLAGLAVPPAYEDVLYARDPAAHLQAV